MSDTSIITITGNLVGDPEQKTTTNGKAVVEFTVAVSRYDRRQRAEKADYYRVSVWSEREQAWLMGKAQKGTGVAVTGAYDQTPRQGEGVFNNISQPTVKLMSRLKGAGHGYERQAGGVAGSPTTAPSPRPFDNDGDIPF
jgi:single-stranded DNA-binding protein